MLINFYSPSLDRKSESVPSFDSDANNTAPSSDSPPGKAASKDPHVKTPCAVGKQPTRAFVPSEPCLIRQAEETHSTPSATSPTQAEMDIHQTSEHSQPGSDETPYTSSCIAEVRRIQVLHSWRRRYLNSVDIYTPTFSGL